ncbi:MAG TPA: zf-HC2 domain-containing protein [Candidatus Dormibacteraeota bacterium]
MTCRSVRGRLEAYVDGRLEAPAAQGLRAHLLACPACAEQHRVAAMLPARLRALPAPAAPDLAPAVLARVRAARGRPELSFALATLELVLGCLILVQLSGFAGLATAAGGALRDAGWLLGSSRSTPVPVPGDLFLFLGLVGLIACSAAHLALLSRSGRRRLV